MNNLDNQNAADQEKSSGAATRQKPCDRCQRLHLKCIRNSSSSDDTCTRCERSGYDCVLGKRKTKFRNVFLQDSRQTRELASSIDTTHTPDLAEQSISHEVNLPSEPGPATLPTTAVSNNAVRMNQSQLRKPMSQDRNIALPDTSTSLEDSTFYESMTTEFGGSVVPDLATTSLSPIAHPVIEPSSIWPNLPPIASHQSPNEASQTQNERRMPATARASFSTRYFDLSGTISAQDRVYLEYVMIRYFYEELVSFCDWCDPDRHFATVVPSKIRVPGPLRSAILTFAARHMSRNKRYRNAAGKMEWRGRLVPDPKEEAAMLYHNECIREVLRLSMDPENLNDESLLAAVTILRTDEEMGFNTDEEQEDQQLFLKIANVIINTQLPRKLTLPHTSLTFVESPRDLDQTVIVPDLSKFDNLGVAGLRQSCIWTALRQDLHASLSKQQPVKFPLSRCEAFRRFGPARDGVWTNRIVTFCADVVEYAFGSDSCDGTSNPAYNDQPRWNELRKREQMFTELLPDRFQPVYYSEVNLIHGVFPEIWHLNHWVIAGVTYIELARIILEIYNPTILKLGSGSRSAIKASITAAKRVLLRLCGVALTNDHCSPSLINACLGIMIIGEHFEDPTEQQGLLAVLALMYDRHAYQSLSGKIANALKRAWNNEESSPASVHRHAQK